MSESAKPFNPAEPAARRALFEQAAVAWGVSRQLRKLGSEAVELANEALHADEKNREDYVWRNKDASNWDGLAKQRDGLIDEMADVLIMIEQLAYLLDIEDELAKHEQFKLIRLHDLLNPSNTNDLPF